jgi:hypothetical protein
MGGQTDLSVATATLYPQLGVSCCEHPAQMDDVCSTPMNGAVALPLDLNELRITASGGPGAQERAAQRRPDSQ